MTKITEKLVSSVTDVLAMLDEQNASALFGDDFTHVSKSIKKTAWKSKKLHQSSDRKPAISVYGPSQAWVAESFGVYGSRFGALLHMPLPPIVCIFGV